MDGAQLFRQLVPDSRFNDDRLFAGAHDDRVRSQENLVQGIGRGALFPRESWVLRQTSPLHPQVSAVGEDG